MEEQLHVFIQSHTDVERPLAPSRQDIKSNLNKVKALTLLPDDTHVTTQMVADYYEVDYETVKKLFRRHREELEGDGMKSLVGKKCAEYVRDMKSLASDIGISPTASRIMLFPRRAVLRIGMLLRDSEVAKRVRFQAIHSLVYDHNDEMNEDGMRVIRGSVLKEYKGNYLSDSNLKDQYKFASKLTLLTRRAVLRIGMLLRDSEVAKKVRTF